MSYFVIILNIIMKKMAKYKQHGSVTLFDAQNTKKISPHWVIRLKDYHK